MEAEHKYLLEQRNWNSFNTLSDATNKLIYKTEGKLVYITNDDKFYYWKSSLNDWALLNSTIGGVLVNSFTTTEGQTEFICAKNIIPDQTVVLINGIGLDPTLISIGSTPQTAVLNIYLTIDQKVTIIQ